MILLAAGVGIFSIPGSPANSLEIGTTSVPGGPTSYNPASAFTNPNNRTYISIGNGLKQSTVSSGGTVGSTSVVLASGGGASFAQGDKIIFTDNSSAGGFTSATAEANFISSISTDTLTLRLPNRYSHAANTYVVQSGNPTATSLKASTTLQYSKGMDNDAPSVVSYGSPTNPTIIYKATFGSSATTGGSSQTNGIAPNEVMVGVMNFNVAPPAGLSTGTGQSTAVSSSTPVAIASPLPSPVSAQGALGDVILQVTYRLIFDVTGLAY